MSGWPKRQSFFLNEEGEQTKLEQQLQHWKPEMLDWFRECPLSDMPKLKRGATQPRSPRSCRATWHLHVSSGHQPHPSIATSSVLHRSLWALLSLSTFAFSPFFQRIKAVAAPKEVNRWSKETESGTPFCPNGTSNGGLIKPTHIIVETMMWALSVRG